MAPATTTIDGGEGYDVFALAGDSLDDYLIIEADGVTTVTDLNPVDGDEGTDTFVNIEEIGFIVLGTEDADRLFTEKDKPVVVAGLDGDDFYVLVNQDDFVLERINEGNDSVEAGITRRLEANVENLTLTGDADVDGFGNQLSNEINGNSGDNVIDGGAGADEMTGGAGADTYHVDHAGDQVTETGIQRLTLRWSNSPGTLSRDRGTGGIYGEDIADDIDQVVATISYALTDFVENLTLSGDESINGTGNALDNVLTGNEERNRLIGLEGSDRIAGADGDDILSGGIGDDAIDGGAGLDTAVFSGNFADYDISLSGGAITVSDLREFLDSDGTDVLVDVENLHFADGDRRAAQLVDPNGDGLLWDSSIAVIDGSEVSASEAQLIRTYLGGLGRLPNTSGFEFWLDKIYEGHPLVSIAKGFVDSPEFQAIADADSSGDLSNDEFLTHMYRNVFGREPDNEGYGWWLGQLDDGNKIAADRPGRDGPVERVC